MNNKLFKKQKSLFYKNQKQFYNQNLKIKKWKL